jgi:hypothetical protein
MVTAINPGDEEFLDTSYALALSASTDQLHAWVAHDPVSLLVLQSFPLRGGEPHRRALHLRLQVHPPRAAA